MKTLAVYASLLATATALRADIVEFDISPPGTSPAVGLSPSNELHAIIGRGGSGNEILTGIRFNTTNNILDLAVGYGSIAGFTDLTGPATAAHIHGPAATTNEAPVIVDLSALHHPAADPAKGGLIFGSVTLDATTASNLLAGLTYLNVHTQTNGTGEIRGQLIPLTNAAPTITALEPQTLECTSSNGALATLTVTVTDSNNDPLAVVWTVDDKDVQTNMIAGGTTAAGVSVQFQANFGLGTHDVTATVGDPTGASASTTTTVTVVDTMPPVIESVTASPSVLWPPNHKLVPVTIRVRATDACGPLRARIVRVTSNENDNGRGDGNTTGDYEFNRPARLRGGDSADVRMLGPLRVLLRAERSGPGSGRVYTVEVEVLDAANNSARSSVTVTVPHDQGRGRGHGKKK